MFLCERSSLLLIMVIFDFVIISEIPCVEIVFYFLKLLLYVFIILHIVYMNEKSAWLKYLQT